MQGAAATGAPLDVDRNAGDQVGVFRVVGAGEDELHGAGVGGVGGVGWGLGWGWIRLLGLNHARIPFNLAAVSTDGSYFSAQSREQKIGMYGLISPR
jgi:hypothetical protein